MERYECPYCGAHDSGKCDFIIDDRTGSVRKKDQNKAREVGCRVMYYTDRRVDVARQDT
jgi:hypothetical protein